MCGIAGVFNYATGEPPERSVVSAMAGRMAHRGPDGEGFHEDGPCALAHRRLSILDLSGGAQPLSNGDGTVWVSFNGEIYNYRPLAAELAARGHRFRTRSDTETIVHAYEERGEGVADALQGMFSFAIRDGRRRRLLLARDRAGIKPLYYHDDGARLVFASEIGALLEHPGVPREADPEAARPAARRFRTEHHELLVTPERFVEKVPHFIRHMEKPVIEAAAVPLLALSRLVRDHITVVLSGEGADEDFGGYEIYRAMLGLEALGRLPAGTGALLARAFAALGLRKAARYGRMAGRSLPDRYRGVSLPDLDAMAPFLAPRVRGEAEEAARRRARPGHPAEATGLGVE